MTVAGALLVSVPALGLTTAASAAGALATPAPPAAGPAVAPQPGAVSAPRVYKLGQRTLRPGDRGKDVRKLQKLLGVKRTGYFNKRTGKAVRKVERKYGLVVDTVVDAPTLAAVKKYAKAKAKRKARASRDGGGSAGTAKRFARGHIDDKYGWGARQMACLVPLWERESGWNYRASNPNGRYHGIPQTSSGVWEAQGYSRSEYMGSAAIQVRVGAKYIDRRYGTPCAAWSFWKSHHWY
jgi:Putative peptidoglycan binding domain